jgi:anti-sigma B factor antagonist
VAGVNRAFLCAALWQRFGIMSSIINSRREIGTLYLEVALPQLDAAAAKRVKDEFGLLDLAGVARVVVDLKAVQFVDSSGVGTLLNLYKRLPAGSAVRLAGVQPPVQAVLELLRLHRVFEIAG